MDGCLPSMGRGPRQGVALYTQSYYGRKIHAERREEMKTKQEGQIIFQKKKTKQRDFSSFRYRLQRPFIIFS